MLQFIRDTAKGWLAWVIVGLISIPFALWGVNSYISGPSAAIVAKVNGDAVMQSEFQKIYQQYRDRMRRTLGEEYQPELFDSIAVKRSVLDGIIEEKLVFAASRDSGVRISDASLNKIIQSNPAFQREGKFDPEYYAIVLQRTGSFPERYEDNLRVSLLTRAVVGNIQKTTFVTKTELENISRLEAQTREISYGVVSAQTYHDQVTVSDETVRQYYDSHLNNYMAPERTKVDYLELAVEQLAVDIEVDDAALQQLYVDNQGLFVVPEQRSASHILIELSEDDDSVILATLAEIKSRLNSGEDFAILAEEYSQDSGSVKNGGDLGYFQRGVMGPEFEAEVFSMEALEQVSEPVKSEFGYHLIKLTGIRPSEEKAFSEVRDELELMYRRQQAEQLFYDKAELLADLSYENPDSLDYVAEQLGLKVQTTDDFTRGGGMGISSDNKVITAAFSDDVLHENLNSSVIELSTDHLLVLHLNKYTLASQLPYESVAPAITEQLKFELASEMAVNVGKGILDQVKSGAEAALLFAEGAWQIAQSYGRDSDELSPQVVKFAFELAKPSEAQTEYGGFTATNGNYIVVGLSSINKEGMAELDEDKRDGLTAHLRRTYGDSEVLSLIAALKHDADIEVFTQYLE